MRQLLDQKNKTKVKKAAYIEEIQVELAQWWDVIDISLMRMRMRMRRRIEEEDVYMYPINMTPDERAKYQAACRASKASEWNRQQEEGFARSKRKMGKYLT